MWQIWICLINLNLPNSNSPNSNLSNSILPNSNFQNLKVKKWCKFFAMYQFSYRPPEEKRSQKKSQQSKEVWAVLKYTCYLLLCLLDLWSTFEGLIKLKQIPFLIYSSIWEIRNCEGRKRETISGGCYSLSGWKGPSDSPQMFITYNLKQA